MKCGVFTTILWERADEAHVFDPLFHSLLYRDTEQQLSSPLIRTSRSCPGCLIVHYRAECGSRAVLCCAGTPGPMIIHVSAMSGLHMAVERRIAPARQRTDALLACSAAGCRAPEPLSLSLSGASDLTHDAVSALLRLPALLQVDVSGCSRIGAMDRMRLLSKTRAGHAQQAAAAAAGCGSLRRICSAAGGM